ncbi:MAG: hypothetical protein CEE38_23560 [Planctomycetes bacterium B3_Pla]|nr:MAG: hypothetical protein CEE38_23560 [Planctomycetes bacterium B3_Pla]
MVARSDITAVTWRRLGEMEPMANFDRTLRGSLATHNAKFVADRVRRIERVSKMNLEQQCKYYRRLGFFK